MILQIISSLNTKNSFQKLSKFSVCCQVKKCQNKRRFTRSLLETSFSLFLSQMGLKGQLTSSKAQLYSGGGTLQLIRLYLITNQSLISCQNSRIIHFDLSCSRLKFEDFDLKALSTLCQITHTRISKKYFNSLHAA